ncbi:MAG: hypothetical protein JOZ87_37900 [Chloroflexi bacterium]|nr:hypothetical protein [Chloroflexota bacterium]
MRWLTFIALVMIASACGPNAAPIALEAQATSTPVLWQIEPTPTAGPPTATAALAARPPAAPTLAPAPTPTGGARAAPTVAPPPFGATATPARAPLQAGPGGQPAPPVPTVGPASPPMAAPPTLGPVTCQFADRTVSVPLYSTPVAPTGLTVYAAGEPMPGLHLELRLPRTTFVAGAVIQPEIAVRNTGSSAAAVVLSAFAWPQIAPADPRSLPIFRGGPAPAPPPLVVPPGEMRTATSLVQLPFDAAQPAQVRGVVRTSGSTLTADVPLKLTVAGPAQQLKIDLHADQHQWCARATDSNGLTPAGPLVASMTGRATNLSMQAGASISSLDATWAGRFSLGSGVGPLTLSVFVGGQNYETGKADTTISL